MRATIISPERGNIPINAYSIAVATSGFGKGHSVNLMERVIADFRKDFVPVFQEIAERSIFDLAKHIAAAKGGDEQQEADTLATDFRKQGHAPFIFDSGTAPAVKQLRYKLQLARCGSINFQMDEMGSNLLPNTEVLNVLLELYDLGKSKTKLIKNTAENERGVDLTNETPANALMFGTLSKLFDGSKTEEEFFSFLETGYARRCFFGVGKPESISATASAETMYDSLVSKNKSQALSIWRNRLKQYANIVHYNKKIQMPRTVGIELVAYRLFCEGLANTMPEHETIRKAELSHRYFKTMKLAGVYAFLDGSDEITIPNLYQAIKVSEESGRSFNKLLTRERNFVRLAKFIAASEGELTHADLVEDLPYYPASTAPRRDIMDLAMAWGVGNHVVIKRNVVSGVEFFSGSTLQETDLNKLSFSLSTHFANDYSAMQRPLDDLPKLLKAPGYHWCNHAFKDEHRKDDNVIQGFNLLVVDVDGTISLKKCQELLAQYTHITATTKRHTEDVNRFRLVMPTNYNLFLDKEDYRAFMDSFLLWLPFDSDKSANQISKKWMTFDGSQVTVHKGTHLVDVLPFIPKTKQNKEYITSIADLGKLNNLERWFLNNMEVGNRNNHLLNFAMMLMDGGASYNELKSRVMSINERSSSPLTKDEIETTVLKSVAQKMNSR